MKTKKVIAAIAALMVAGTLGGCSGGARGRQRRDQLHQQDHQDGRAGGDSVGVVSEHGARRRQLQQAARRRPGLLDQRWRKVATSTTSSRPPSRRAAGLPTWSWWRPTASRHSRSRARLVDISDYGYADVKDNFSEGAWKDVSVGDGVYGAPIDGGPMGMIYRTGRLRQVRHHPADHLGGVSRQPPRRSRTPVDRCSETSREPTSPRSSWRSSTRTAPAVHLRPRQEGDDRRSA